MATIFLYALQNFLNILWYIAVDLIKDQLGIAQNGVEGGSEFVAHVGEEVGLVFAGDLELAPLCLELAEKPCVLDCQGRLGGERLEEVNSFFLKLARCSAPNHQPTDEPVFAK